MSRTSLRCRLFCRLLPRRPSVFHVPKPLHSTHVTPRQSEILDLIAAGLADKEIAEKLGLSYGTVRTQLSRFFAANGIRGRAGAVALWVRAKPADPQRPMV
ncbi:MAG: helix-turn-helix transcriptional regulator [Chloroflexi bacterium]|nr:MAG: helix-turn-helix transcriptional regulator [Chloroflexota bacterium]